MNSPVVYDVIITVCLVSSIAMIIGCFVILTRMNR